ncbi:MAG: hypothetical protein ACLP0H_01535 [Terriglobales bacterium]
MPSMRLSTGVIPRDRECDLSGIKMARPSALSGRKGRRNPTTLGSGSSASKAASDRIGRHPQEVCEIP